MESYIKELLLVCKGKPVSLEVISHDYKNMISEAKILYKSFNKIAHNVYIKIPVNPCLETECSMEMDGIKAIKNLSEEGIPVNCTLVFTPEQAILAAKAGAKIVSPFVGREDDYIRDTAHIKFNKDDYFPKKGWKVGQKKLEDNGIISGINLIEEISSIFKKQNIKTEILAASIRNTRQVRESIESGADIVTLPLKVLNELANHKKTAEGMQKFTKDIIPEYSKIFKKK